MEEPGGLQSMGSQRVRHDWVTSLSLSFIKTEQTERSVIMKDMGWKEDLVPGEDWERASQVTQWIKNLSAMQETQEGSIPGLRRFPEEGHGKAFKYSYLENPMDRGAWWATIHRAAERHDWSDWAHMPKDWEIRGRRISRYIMEPKEEGMLFLRWFQFAIKPKPRVLQLMALSLKQTPIILSYIKRKYGIKLSE